MEGGWTKRLTKKREEQGREKERAERKEAKGGGEIRGQKDAYLDAELVAPLLEVGVLAGVGQLDVHASTHTGSAVGGAARRESRRSKVRAGGGGGG